MRIGVYVMLRFLIALVAVLGFSFHSTAMAGPVDLSCSNPAIHGGVADAEKTQVNVGHGFPQTVSPCCASGCTLLFTPIPDAIVSMSPVLRVPIEAEGVWTTIQLDGPRRPPKSISY